MVVRNGGSSTYYPGMPDYKGRGRAIKGVREMTKQEEIDWGLRNLIRELTNEDGTIFLYKASIKTREYLKSMGVVIKVDMECTSDFICDDYMNGLGFLVEHGRTPTYLELDRFIKALGYVAFKELV